MAWGSSICSNRSRDLFNLSQSPVSLPLSDPDLGVLILITHNDVTNISAFNQQEMQRLSREETHATNNKMFSPVFLKSCVLHTVDVCLNLSLHWHMCAQAELMDLGKRWRMLWESNSPIVSHGPTMDTAVPRISIGFNSVSESPMIICAVSF